VLRHGGTGKENRQSTGDNCIVVHGILLRSGRGLPPAPR
jgi:hypothetical protein